MTETTFIPTQRATQSLKHGKVTWETDNSNIVRLKLSPQDSDSDYRAPEIEFIGEGVATYEIKMIYQPTPESFPCLISNPRYRYQVFWNSAEQEYQARPIDGGEYNRSMQWLHEGVLTMNALHDFSQSEQMSLGKPRPPSDSKRGSLSQSVAEIAGTFVGAASRAYFSST